MGTLRIHFTGDDLARTTVAAAADPLWEVVFSRFRLRERVRRPAFRPWIDELRANPARTVQMRDGVALLEVLAPLAPYWPDFLTPVESRRGLETGLDTVMSTPPARIRAELRRLSQHRRLPGWISGIAAGQIDEMTRIGDCMRSYYAAAIEPCQHLVHAAVAADRAQRARDLLEGGVEGLLAGFGALMRWDAPVLEVSFDFDAELHLEGRGLKLVPSYFNQRNPVTFGDPGLQPVLLYPIENRFRWSHSGVSGKGLEDLLGRTRAAVLLALVVSTTTTELARALHISPAAVSRHTGVLREAGLIATRRDGTAVLHTVSPLGTALIEGHAIA
ncbi:winged helix-turn-helix domain-containing protein [Nonomuraea longicatena]|uniref:Winged helix-turn-helix domain-containing protein n=1 Tax=Nonomuraea longicatena TaxID=83682 RepID=A0ABN1P9Q2_9ACTN